MSKLTKSFIDNISIPAKKPNGKADQVFYRDSSLIGFGLRVGSGGSKSFFVEHRINGRVKRISIGRYGHLTPVQARNKAQELLGEIAQGIDPRDKQKALSAKTVTLGTAYKDYLRTRKNLKPGTIKSYNHVFNGNCGDWLNTRLVDIDKDMIERRHEEIGKRSPATANHLMRVLRAVFNHALAKYEDKHGNPLIPSNPVARLSQNRAWYKVDRRRTYLKPNELKPWFEATMEIPEPVVRDYLHFILFTGLRKMEAATLRWSDVSFKDETFTIADTKNSEPHTLPFSDAIKGILERRKQESSNDWVFPSPVSGTHLKDPRHSMETLYKNLGRRVTLHDLRRTFITIAESLDISAYALKRLLNHTDKNDVTAGYIVFSVDRLREPIAKISNFINRSLQNGS